MKYVLKKDLPFAKAGAKVKPQHGSLFDSMYVNRDPNHGGLAAVFIGTREDLLRDGWIEEVKEPREWWAVTDEFDNLYYTNHTKEYAEEKADDMTNRYKTPHRAIKVREVK